MRIDEYPKYLEILAQYKYVGKYLEPSSSNIIFEAANQIRESLKRSRDTAKWKLVISYEDPLTFLITDMDGYKLQIDTSCELEGIGTEIKQQKILLRVWSCDEKISYREGIDAPELKERLEGLDWKRLMVRFHLDLRNPDVKKPEPLYHLQIGGTPRPDEYCWFPKKLEVPRFPYPPMDLILLCEFILANFFPEGSEDLRKNPEWKSLVRHSQDFFLKPYHDMCMRYLGDDNETLLGNLVASL